MSTIIETIHSLQLHNKLVVLHNCGTRSHKALLAKLTTSCTVVDMASPVVRMQVEQNAAAFVSSLQTMAMPLYLANIDYAPQVLTLLLQDAGLPLGSISASCNQTHYLQEECAGENAGRIAFLELPLTVAASVPFVPTADVLQTLQDAGRTTNILENILLGFMADKDEADSYVQRILRQEIAGLAGPKDDLKFYRFLCAAASLTALPVNTARLGDMVGVSLPTVRRWLNLLAGAGIVYFVQPVANIPKKRLVKAPKMFFRDTAVACALLQLVNSNDLLRSINYGRIYETYVVNSIREGYLEQGREAKLTFFQDSNYKEITIILEVAGVLYPMLITTGEYKTAKVAKLFSVLEPYAAEHALAMGNGVVMVPHGDTKQLQDRLWQVNVTSIL